MNATVLFDALTEIEPDLPSFISYDYVYDICDKLMDYQEALELDYDTSG